MMSNSYLYRRSAHLTHILLCALALSVSSACDSDEPSPTGGETIAGESAGDLAGDSPIDVAGDNAGESAGDISGEAAGESSSGAQAGTRPESADYTQVKLNEVTPRGEPFDWVEVINLGDQEINLAGCGLSDDLNEPQRYVIPEGAESIVPAGGFLVIVISQESTGFGLGGDELVTLSSPSGALIDQIDYDGDDAPAGTSYGRIPDGTGEWRTLYEPTPAAPNSVGSEPMCGDMICSPQEDCPEDCVICGDGICDADEACAEDCAVCGDQLCDEGEVCDLDCAEVVCGDGLCSPEEDCDEDCEADFELVINEIVAAGDPDAIELVNTGDESVDLSAFYLTDDPAEPFKAQLRGTLDAGAYLWLEVSDVTLGFKLRGDEEAHIVHMSGVFVDSVDWDEGASPEGQSYRRVPDLTGDFITGEVTPGAPND